MLSSEAFANITSKILAVAEVVCQGRCVFAHEGGYSKEYVPFCGLAVLESLSGIKSGVVDPSLDEVRNWGYQELQSHQAKVVDAVADRLGLLASVDGNNEANDEVAVLERMETLLRGLPVDSRRAVLAKLSKDFL